MVLVVDTASADDTTLTIARSCSRLRRRLDVNKGYKRRGEQGAPRCRGRRVYVFCHDDVTWKQTRCRDRWLKRRSDRTRGSSHRRSSSGTTRRASRRSAKPATRPECVPRSWNAVTRLEQHDAVADVFCAPGGCMLVTRRSVRRPRWVDPAIDLLGEDARLSWRARGAGARVIVAPAAVVRHLEAGDTSGRSTTHANGSPAQHRSMLTSTGCGTRAGGSASRCALGHRDRLRPDRGTSRRARDLVAAWRWNFARRAEIRANRAALAAVRQLPDSEIRRLQVRGFARLSAFLRGQLGIHDEEDRLQSVTSAGRDLAGSVRSGPLRTPVAVWSAVIVVILFATPAVIRQTPAYGDSLPSEATGTLLRVVQRVAPRGSARIAGYHRFRPASFMGVAFIGGCRAAARTLFPRLSLGSRACGGSRAAESRRAPRRSVKSSRSVAIHPSKVCRASLLLWAASRGSFAARPRIAEERQAPHASRQHATSSRRRGRRAVGVSFRSRSSPCHRGNRSGAGGLLAAGARRRARRSRPAGAWRSRRLHAPWTSLRAAGKPMGGHRLREVERCAQRRRPACASKSGRGAVDRSARVPGRAALPLRARPRLGSNGHEEGRLPRMRWEARG